MSLILATQCLSRTTNNIPYNKIQSNLNHTSIYCPPTVCNLVSYILIVHDIMNVQMFVLVGFDFVATTSIASNKMSTSCKAVVRELSTTSILCEIPTFTSSQYSWIPKQVLVFFVCYMNGNECQCSIILYNIPTKFQWNVKRWFPVRRMENFFKYTNHELHFTYILK